MLGGFFAWNQAAANWIERRLPRRFNRSLLHLHEITVARLINESTGMVVLDVGGGHMSPFAEHRRTERGTYLIGSDILFDQVHSNPQVDAGVVCDACAGLPFRDGSIDLIVTRSVLEHLPDNAAFVAECHRVLKPGGRAAHVFPGRRAPFALLNRVLPNALVKWLILTFFPGWSDECGFRAFYDSCAYPEMLRLHKRAGLEVEAVELRYYQSIYFKPLLPVYLISLAYDLVLWLLDVKPLSSQLFIVAHRPA